MSATKVFRYNDIDVSFEYFGGNIMANVTQMFRIGNARLDHWKESENTKRYMEAITRNSGISENQLIITRPGSSLVGGGTWIHERLVLNAARYISVEFEIQCDLWLAELHRTGTVSLNPVEITRKDLALMVIKAEEEKELLLLENRQLKFQQQIDQPKAEFYDAVTGSKDVTDLGTVAKLLNIRGMGRTKLFAELRSRKVLMADNKPYQVYVDRGWFRVIETKWSKPDGSQHINFKTVVFQKGIAAIRDMLTKGDTPAPHTALPEPHQYDYEH